MSREALKAARMVDYVYSPVDDHEAVHRAMLTECETIFFVTGSPNGFVGTPLHYLK